ALVIPPERIPGMHTMLACGRDDLARVPGDSNCELLESRRLGKGRLESGTLRETLLRVRAERQARLTQLPQPLRSQPRQVDEPAQGEQSLVRGDVGGRLLPPDVLLPGLQREDVAALARGVHRLADDPSGHAADEHLPCREEAVV